MLPGRVASNRGQGWRKDDAGDSKVERQAWLPKMGNLAGKARVGQEHLRRELHRIYKTRVCCRPRTTYRGQPLTMLKFFPSSFADQLTPKASAASSHQAEPNPFDASLGAGAQAPAAGQQSSTQGAPPSRHHLLLQTHSYLQPPPPNSAGDLTPLGQSIPFSCSPHPRAHSPPSLVYSQARYPHLWPIPSSLPPRSQPPTSL